METSSVNTSHNQGTSSNTKEENKLKSMLQGSYDFIHRETGKMIHKKAYKRAYQLLDRFYNSRKDLELSEMVQINRRIGNCINKILKQNLLKPDIEQERPDALLNIFKRGTHASFESYKYLNLYIQKVIPNEAKGVVLEDVSHLTSSEEEEEERIQEPEVTVLKYKINEYKQQVKPKHPKQSVQSSNPNPYEQEKSESSRIADMVQKSTKPLNIQFELDFYWLNLMELQLMAAMIFKKAQKFKIAYYYLVEADRIGQSILETSNPNLVNMCARVKIYLANFLYELGENGESLQVSEDALVILQGEMRMRLNQEKFVLKQNKNRERKRQKRCVSTLLSVFVTIMCNYEEQSNFHRMIETLVTASWVGEKFIQGIDEFKKHIIKLAQEGRHRLESMLKELADLSYVAESILDQELHRIRMKEREKMQNSQSEYLKKFNEDMYNLFQLKPLNQQLYMKLNIKEQNQQQMDHRLESDHLKQPVEQHLPQGTDASVNIFDSDSQDDSFFDGSFFAPSIDNIEIDSKIQEEKRPQTANARKAKSKPARRVVAPKNPKKQGKSVGLIKIGFERPTEYKSRILTTTQYFQEFKTTQEILQVNKVDDELRKRWLAEKKKLQNLHLRQHPDQDEQQKQDLDVFVNKLVSNKIEDGQIREYNSMLKDLQIIREKEDFDKKEFHFGKKMLNLKSKEELKPTRGYIRNLPVKIEVDTKVKNHAFIVDGKFNSEATLKELKRRKIDIMVAGKKIQNQVNISLKDPEETNYLKKVLENSKKKKLKDLIYKHREALGLTKYFTNLLREQKEQERLLKLKYAVEKEAAQQSPDLQAQREGSPKDITQSKKNVRISIHQSKDKELQPAVQQVKGGKGILKRPPESVSVSPMPSQKQIDARGTDLLLIQEQQAKAKRQQKELIEKQQKKSHQVVGMIIDAVERKLDQESKDLKKMLFTQKGGSRQYVDDDERTYLRFMPKYTDLSRSTYLMFIKRELQEKQQYTFEDIALLRYQLNKKMNIAEIALQAKEASI